MKPEWISAIANAVTAFAVFLAWLQIKEMNAQTRALNKQAADDHDRSRREKAVALLAQWSSSLTQKSSITRKLVETMDEQQSRDLFKQNAVSVRKDQEALISAVISDWDAAATAISQKQSTEIRWTTVGYLNALESVLSAWRHNVADRSVLEEQFGYLVSDQEGHFILEKFRVASGGDQTFPSIGEFVTHVRIKRKNHAPGKEVI